MQLKIGLILGDSILHGYFQKDTLLCSKMKEHFDLDVITTDFRPGKTTNFLVKKVFPWQMSEFVNRHDCDILVDVFLASGAVDLSDSIHDDLHFDFEEFLSNRNADLKIVMDHPFVRRLIVYPLTPRCICQNDLQQRFPKYAKNSWILKANRCAQDVNQSNINFHSKLHHVPPLLPNQLLDLVAEDGIHLDKDGKRKFAWSVLQVCEQKILSQDEFPPLKQGKGEISPLKSIDVQLANFEAKKRDEKRNRNATLIETRCVKIHSNLILEKGTLVKCSPSGKEKTMQTINVVSIKVTSDKMKQRKRRRAKDEVLQNSIDCAPIDAFANQNQSKKRNNGEVKQVDRLVKNILRKRSANKTASFPFMSFFDCDHLSSKVTVHADTKDMSDSNGCENSTLRLSARSLHRDFKKREFSQSEFFQRSQTKLFDLIEIRKKLKNKINFLKQQRCRKGKDLFISRCRNMSQAHDFTKNFNVCSLDEPSKEFDNVNTNNTKMNSLGNDVEKKLDSASCKANVCKKKRQKVLKQMKKFFCPPADSNSPYQDYEKLRVTFHTRKGLLVEHVDANGTTDVIHNNLNLSGGGKRSASDERARKRAQRQKQSEDKKEVERRKAQERMQKLREDLDEEQREELKEQDKGRKQTIREEMEEEKKEELKEQDKARKQKMIDQLDEEKREELKEKNKGSQQKMREDQDELAKDKQRKEAKQRMQSLRAKKKSEKRKEKESSEDESMKSMIREMKKIKVELHDEAYQAQRLEIENGHKRFFNAIANGPNYYCACCCRGFFRDQVVKLTNEVREKTVFHEGVQIDWFVNVSSIDEGCYICRTCRDHVSNSRLPKLGVANCNDLPTIPDFIKNLNDGEERLVSPRTFFIRVQSLGIGAQKGIVSNAVNVPIPLEQTVSQLPLTNTEDTSVITLNFKRKMKYDHSYFTMNIDLANVSSALNYLINTDLYKELDVTLSQGNIQTLQKNLQELHHSDTISDCIEEIECADEDLPKSVENVTDENNTEECSDEEAILAGFSVDSNDGNDGDHEGDDDSDDDNDDDGWTEKTDEDSQNVGSSDTMILNENEDIENISTALKSFSIAPGEGQVPLPLTLDQHALRAAYPTLFGGQLPKKNCIPLSIADVAKLYMEHRDPRFRLHPHFCFALYRVLQTFNLKNSVFVNLKKNKCLDGSTITAKDILGSQGNNLIQHNSGYKVLMSDRSSPAYWQKIKNELVGMVRQIGMPTFFLTFSAAETIWPDVIKSLYFEKYGKVLTLDEIARMSWSDKVTLIRENPISTSRHFDHRFRMFFNMVVKPTLGYNDEHDDYFMRIEFQQRGSPHVHMIVWLESAPKYGTHDKQSICEFIDKFITVDLPGTELAQIPYFLKCQVHRHTMTCKKKKRGSSSKKKKTDIQTDHKNKKENKNEPINKKIKSNPGKYTCRFGFPRKPFPRTTILEPLDLDHYINQLHPNVELSAEEFKDKKDNLKKKLGCDVRKINGYLSSLDLSDAEIFNMTFDVFLKNIEMDQSSYILAVSFEIKKPTVFLKRGVKSIRANNYNETLLKVWGGNMDIQYILNPYSVCQYIVSYIGKSYRGMSKLLRKVTNECKKENKCLRDQFFKICREFQGASEISSQEVGYNLMQMPLTSSSRTKVRINTYPIVERVKMLKSAKALASLSPESEDIFYSNCLQRYALRDKDSENVNLIDFVSGRLTDKKTKVVLYYSYNPDTDFEEFSRVQLLLFNPWRNEAALAGDFETHADKYLSIKPKLEQARAFYHNMEKKVLETAMNEYEYDINLVPVVDEAESQAKIVNDHQNKAQNTLNLIPTDISNELGFDYQKEDELTIKKRKVESNDMHIMFRTLNLKQKEIFLEIVNRETKGLPYHFTVIGKAGTGKSKVLKAINTYVDHFHSTMRGNDPNVAYNIICAYTGNAAFNASGHTFHSALGIRAMKGYDNASGMIADKTLSHLIDVFSHITHLSGDEFTYIGSSMLSKINRHLKLIKQNPRDDFGGINMVFYGDPCQLGPVADKHIFEYDAKDPYGVISGGSLFEKFSSFELTEIMRQTDIGLQNALCDLADASSPMSPKNIDLLRSCQKNEDELDIEPNKRIDLFAFNADVNMHNERMIAQVKEKSHMVAAQLSIMGDESKTVKDKVKQAIRDRQNHTETVGLRLNVDYKIEGRYFIPVNVDLTDGLVNGAIGTLKHIDLDNDGNPVTLWMKFDSEEVGKSRRQMLVNCGPCTIHVKKGLTPIWKVAKNFPTCRKRLTGQIVMFPLYYAYGFTICKAQGNNHIGISTVVHMNTKKKIPRKQLYVALSRTDTIENLIIIGSFEDPWFREEEARKKTVGMTRQDEIIAGYSDLLAKKIILSWTPLYNLKECNKIISFFNVNSLNCHIDDVINDFSLLSSNLIFFIDTRLKDKDNLKIEGYNFVAGLNMNNTKRVPGGICLYSSEDQQVCKIKEIDIQERGYFCQLLVCLSIDCIIIGLYFSPKCPLMSKVNALKMALTECVGYEQDVVIGGDFNCEQNIDFLIEQGFSSLPLDLTTKYGSSIDHLYIKSGKNYIFGSNPCYYSDHNPLFVAFKSNEISSSNDERDGSVQDMDCSSNSQVLNCDSSHLIDMDCVFSNDDIQEVTTSQFYENQFKEGQVYLIDRLSSNSSIDLLSFLGSFNYKILNCNSNTQIGLSCGYICASIASYIYHLQQFSSLNLTQGEHKCYNPDVVLYNNILNIDGNEAQILDSIQIMKLVTYLTGDCNLEWFFTVDVNMFKSFARSDFSNLHLPSKGNKRWGVFCVNDAVLTEKQRASSLALNKYNGSHWYTAAVILE